MNKNLKKIKNRCYSRSILRCLIPMRCSITASCVIMIPHGKYVIWNCSITTCMCGIWHRPENPAKIVIVLIDAQITCTCTFQITNLISTFYLQTVFLSLFDVFCCFLFKYDIFLFIFLSHLWLSYQIHEIVGCAYAGNTGNVSPAADFKGNRLVSDPSVHHGTCVTHVPWCMSGSPTRGGEENLPGIPGACATLNFTNQTTGPCNSAG